MNFDVEACAWLSRSTGIAPARLIMTPMRGATSSSLYLVQDVEAERRFVLRLFTRREWLQEQSDLVAHEAAALREAANTGLIAPELVNACEDADPFGVPAVLMTHVPGQVELKPHDARAWLSALAKPLARLHQHAADGFGWHDKSWVDDAALQVPTWTSKPRLWERAIELWRNGEPSYRPVFIHRDYHPVNVLWQGEVVSGVVDWVNACRGPAPRDVAHCRMNLAQMFGMEAADEFLNAYLKHVGDTLDDYAPFWDVDDLLNMSLPQPEFYPPWQEFGLDFIALDVLQRRTDAYLESVMRRA